MARVPSVEWGLVYLALAAVVLGLGYPAAVVALRAW